MDGWVDGEQLDGGLDTEFDRAMCRKMGRALDGGMSRKID